MSSIRVQNLVYEVPGKRILDGINLEIKVEGKLFYNGAVRQWQNNPAEDPHRFAPPDFRADIYWRC